MDWDALKDLLFTWEGRVNRAKWWAVGFGSWLAMFVLVGVAIGLNSISSALGVISYVVLAGVYIALAVAGVMVAIKRWHDRGKSGWWIFIVLVPIIGSLWALIELGFLAGDPNSNEWGPNPLDPAAARRG